MTIPATRRCTEGDRELVRRIHHAAYRDVVTRQFGPWDEARQDRFFADKWSPDSFGLVLEGDVAVGYVAIEDRGDHVFLSEVVLDPIAHGRGLGTRIVLGVIADAAARGLPVRLQVLRLNRARALYERLGFVATGETATQVQMERPLPRTR